MRKKILIILSFLFLFISCKKDLNEQKNLETDQKEAFLHQSANSFVKSLEEAKKQRENLIQNYVSSMTLQDKICQLFLVNLEGNESFSPIEFFESKAVIPGGYLFFQYNISDSKEKTKSFIDSIFSYCQKESFIKPYIAVDQEGGYVSRLKKITNELPSQEEIAKSFSTEEAFNKYSQQAKDMHFMGFTLNLAPVTEVCTKENADFLDTRSFGNRQQVLDYAPQAIKAYQNNNVACVLKHFPGNNNVDPHSGLPELSDSEEELEENAISVFKNLIAYRPEAILMSHARTKAFDNLTPACLSSYWVDTVLRKRLMYQGLIFSDDIFMAALAKNGFPPEKAIVMAIDAGVDVLMLSEKHFSNLVELLVEYTKENGEFEEKINSSVKRIIDFKIRHNLISEDFLNGKK